MRLIPFLSYLSALVAFVPYTSAQRFIESKSLNPCQDNSNLTTTLFNVLFTPENRTLSLHIVGVSSINGRVTADAELIAYGKSIMKETLDPCDPKNKEAMGGFCPMHTGTMDYKFNFNELGDDIINEVPGIAYTVPDIDGLIRVYVNDTETGNSVACMEARLSNGKTVYQKGVGWTTAVIAGLGLVASAVTSGLGHSNTAAHVAANALSLFGFFQAQAMVGMTAVTLPPIVRAWTQNFQWTMGIIRVGFLQDIATWYQRATGGTPSTYLSTLATTSVQVQKRSLDFARDVSLTARDLVPRTNSDSELNEQSSTVVVSGIERVGFMAGIEETNIFMTGLIFFMIFVAFVVLFVAMFKGFCEMAAKWEWMKGDKFQDFRNGWRIVMRGILYRLTLIGYPQMCILCLWELTVRDSAAEVVLAVFMFLAMTGTLAWAALKVILLAKRSVAMHKNPAYILYSDPTALNKWGFLYVQYRATAYYTVVPVLIYIVIKAMFIGFAQKASLVQAIAFLILEAAVLVGASVMRPWMDKKTNIYNISIAAINFVNSILLIFFTSVFNQPGIVTGVMGVLFFVLNAAFALILLVLVLIASIYAMVSKNPDTRYQPMRDDRGSFIKSQTQLTTELDALGATARGDVKAPYQPAFDDDDTSYTGSTNRQNPDGTTQNNGAQPPRSPVDPSVPLFPNEPSSRVGPQPTFDNSNGGSEYGYIRSQTTSPPFGNAPSATSNPHQFRTQNNASPWQRGAGYDH